MLEDILAEGDYENYRYRLALCHIPIVYVDKHGYFEAFRNDWTALLNEIDVDMALSGHKHVLWPFVPGQVTPHETLVFDENYPDKGGTKDGGYLTDFNFPGYLVGRRSLVQAGDTQSNGYDQYVGLKVEVNFGESYQHACYINSRGEMLTCQYPFASEAVSVQTTELKRP